MEKEYALHARENDPLHHLKDEILHDSLWTCGAWRRVAENVTYS